MNSARLKAAKLTIGGFLLLSLAACNTTTLGLNRLSAFNTKPEIAETDKPKPQLQASAEEDAVNCFTSTDEQQAFVSDDHSQLWDRIREGYALPATDNARIDTYVKWYTKNPKYIARVTERGEKYLFHIVEMMERYKVPLEIALLPIVESAFDPFAYSHGRASGMWQFVPSTGRQYGLKQNWWYDGRRDVVASTEAAVKFLSYLNRRFDGDWLLALAAYNSGEGNVSKAIKRNKKAGKPTDFWSLKLPRETQAYVPQLLALSKVVRSPQQYKLKLEPIDNASWFTTVDISSQIDMAQAARLAGMDIDQLYKMNPGFNRWATDPDGPHRLLIPNEHAAKFISNLNALPTEERIAWQRYTIKSGDSLIKISKKFNTSVSALQSANSLRGNGIRAGKTLMIPVATAPARHYAYSAAERLKRTQSKSGSKSSKQQIRYTVKPGDSFWKIARKHDVSVSKLSKWNGMAPKDPIKIGQKLVIWTGKKVSQKSVANAQRGTGKSIIRKVAYNVRRGDSLARIAGKFNLTVNDIMRWNPVKKNNYIHPGQSLTLFVDVTRTN